MFPPRSTILFFASALAFLGVSASSVARADWPLPQGFIEQRFERATPELRRQTLLSLADAAPQSALPLLERGLVDPDPEVRTVAAELALRSFNSPRPVPSLVRLVEPWLTSRSASERALAARLFAPSVDRESLRRLVPLLSDYDAQVRRATARALALVPAEVATAAAEALTLAMNDAELEVRREATHSLGLLGQPTGVLSIVGALRDAEAVIRVEAATALGAIGDDRGLDALVASLEDGDSQVVLASVRALALHPKVSRQSALISVAQRSPFDEAAFEATRALALQPDQRATELFFALLQRTDARSAVLELLQADSAVRRDWADCIDRAARSTLRACTMLQLAHGGEVESILRARAEQRVGEDELFEWAQGFSRTAFLVRALRVVSTDAEDLSSGVGQAALRYLHSLSELPSEARGPILQALTDNARATSTVMTLLSLLARLPRSTSLDLDPIWLESSAPAVSFTAALAMTHHGLAEEALRGLLTHPRRSVVQGAVAALAEQATSAQVGVVLEQLVVGNSGLQAELSRALDGMGAPLSPEMESQLQRALLESRWALSSGRLAGLRAREHLLSAVGRWGSEQLVNSASGGLVPADRRTLVQALEHNASAAQLLPRFFDDSSPRVRALALEGAARSEAVLPPQFAQSGPHFVRAAWWRALQAQQVKQGERAPPLPLEPNAWEEACSSQHIGLRAAAWGLAAFRGQPCGAGSAIGALRGDEDLRIRRAVAHALALRLAHAEIAPREREGWKAAVSGCIVYDLDVLVAETCRRIWHNAFQEGKSGDGASAARLTEGQGAAQLGQGAARLQRTRLRVSWTHAEASGVPYPVWQGDLMRVVVSDRAGEVVLSAEASLSGDAALGY